MIKVQVSGNSTIIKSKILPDNDKESLVGASEGKIKKINLPAKDSNGDEVNLGGKLYISQGGSLTSRFYFKLKSAEIVEIEK